MDRVSYVNSNALIRLYTAVMSTWTELYKAPQVPPWSDCDSNVQKLMSLNTANDRQKTLTPPSSYSLILCSVAG